MPRHHRATTRLHHGNHRTTRRKTHPGTHRQPHPEAHHHKPHPETHHHKPHPETHHHKPHPETHHHKPHPETHHGTAEEAHPEAFVEAFPDTRDTAPDPHRDTAPEPHGALHEDTALPPLSPEEAEVQRDRVQEFATAHQVPRHALQRFMVDMRQLMSPAMMPVTLKVGEIGKSYERFEGDLRDAWHSLAVRRHEGYVIEHPSALPPTLLLQLKHVIKRTVGAVTTMLDAQGPNFHGTILHALPRRGDLQRLHEEFQGLETRIAEMLQAFHAAPCAVGRAACTQPSVDWGALVKHMFVIGAIAQRSIDPKRNTRIHTHSADAFAEAIAVGCALRVSMMTALKLLHIMRELQPAAAPRGEAPHAGEGGGATTDEDEEKEGAEYSARFDVRVSAQRREQTAEEGTATDLGTDLDLSTSTLVSPLGDAKRDVEMERALRYLLHLAFRGGFGGVGWMFHGDATMREAEEAATENRMLPRLRRLWRRGRRWIKTPLLSAIATELVNTVIVFLPVAAVTSNPILAFTISMMCRTFLNGVAQGVIRTM